MGQWYKLISSDSDPEYGKCCNYDSQFAVLRANKSHFVNYQDGHRDNCDVSKSVDEQRDFVNVLVCKSHENDSYAIFPLLKEREQASPTEPARHKVINNMRLIEK